MNRLRILCLAAATGSDSFSDKKYQVVLFEGMNFVRKLEFDLRRDRDRLKKHETKLHKENEKKLHRLPHWSSEIKTLYAILYDLLSMSIVNAK